ncbi:MAG: putative DNA-binding domain-containing protein [Acidobacteria bacterium]|nr:putative DNA-binding domain-containing protein [Acidobacteriota bacterium]
MNAGGPFDLRRTQELFWTLITAPEGVRAAIDGLSGRGSIDEASINALFAGDERLPAVERLDIYANMYFYRLLDCLAEDFPKVRAAVGPERFHNLVTDYVLRHPSEHPSLRFLGRRLPEFIRDHQQVAADFPFLADLARLEWARADVFDAPDAAPLSREALASLPQERAGESRFTLIPAFALLRFDHDVIRFWRALDDAGSVPAAAPDGGPAAAPPRGSIAPPARRSAAARVWRKDLVVHHASLDDEEMLCLELAQAGEPLGRICQVLAAGRSPAQATGRAGRMIQAWLEDGILAGVVTP